MLFWIWWGLSTLLLLAVVHGVLGAPGVFVPATAMSYSVILDAGLPTLAGALYMLVTKSWCFLWSRVVPRRTLLLAIVEIAFVPIGSLLFALAFAKHKMNIDVLSMTTLPLVWIGLYALVCTDVLAVGRANLERAVAQAWQISESDVVAMLARRTIKDRSDLILVDALVLGTLLLVLAM